MCRCLESALAPSLLAVIGPLKVIIFLLALGAAFFWKLEAAVAKALAYLAYFLKSKQTRQVMNASSLSFLAV